MPSTHTTVRLVAALAALVLAALAALVIATGGRPTAAVAPPPGTLPAAAPPGPAAGATAGASSSASPAASAADRLEAARTVALYCHLVEAGQFARAGDLCVSRRLWSRRRLGELGRFDFRSARVYAAPDARTLVLAARVRVRAVRGRPLPDGPAIVFFTLGRAEGTVGGWRITAVSTSPQPSGKGSL